MSDSTALTTTTTELAARVLWDDMADEIEDLDGYAKAPATIAGYCSDWSQFTTWARAKGVDLPLCDDDGRVNLAEPVFAEVVKMYIVAKQYDLRSATLQRHLSAIKHWHGESGLLSPTDHPEVAKAMRGLARKHRYSTRQAGALRLYDLIPILPEGDTMKGQRDRALLVWGFWSAMRRSELAAMTVEDLTYTEAGAVCSIPFSKTDQEGHGDLIGVNHQHSSECVKVSRCEGHSPCPVHELRDWIKAAGIKSGPVWLGGDRHGGFRSDAISAQLVSLILKEALETAGQNPATYSAHSLRAGFVSTADEHGVPRAAIRAVTRHKSEAVMSSYARPDQLLRDSAGAYMDNGHE